MTKVLSIVAVLLAGAALAVSIAAFTRDPATTDTVARRQLAHLQQAVNAVHADVERQAGFDGQKLSGRVRKILACLPEIQGELNGLTPEVDAGSVYLTNTQQVSSYCSPVLYGRSTGD
jgi:hypothetical protein